MNNKFLISIAIPTYNRADSLQRLLSYITLKIENMSDLVQICISNNCSTDNTEEVVFNFQKKYPNLIKYKKNEKNFGSDRNVFLVMGMADGNFVWLFGDDDMIVEDGINKVINFINKYCNNNTGLIILGHSVCINNNQNQKNKEVIYLNTSENGKGEIYKMNIKNVMGTSSDKSFLSILIINNRFVKKIMEDEVEIIKKAIGNYYIHSFVYQLMLLKYSDLEVIKFNKIIVDEGPHYRKPFIEDEFLVFHSSRRKLNKLLLSYEYLNEDCKKAIIAEQKRLKMITLKQMGIMKTFGNFNFNSFLGCINLFFKQAAFFDAIFISIFFIFFNICPSFILKNVYKIFIKTKYKKEWQRVWWHNEAVFNKSKISRRITQ